MKFLNELAVIYVDKWLHINTLIDEEQAGYEKGNSTIDNVFNSESVIQKYISKKTL